MNELKRRFDIASQVLDWGIKLANFIHIVGEIGRRDDVSEADKQSLKETAEKLRKLLRTVADMAQQQDSATELFGQLTASLERLNEEMVNGNTLLEKVARKRQ